MKKIILSSLFLAVPVYAHVPYVEGLDFQDDESFTVQPPVEKSLALYLSFKSETDQDRVTLTLTEQDLQDAKAVPNAQGRLGRRITFNTIVPACAPYAAVLPSVALIGPQQQGLTAQLADQQLPFSLAANQGGVVLNNTEQGAVFQENITGTRYFRQKSGELIATVPGTYEIVAWEPQGRIADYVLVVGDEEIFGTSEIMQSIRRLSYLRQGNEIKDAKCRQQLKP
jgi:hypothetical protein